MGLKIAEKHNKPNNNWSILVLNVLIKDTTPIFMMDINYPGSLKID